MVKTLNYTNYIIQYGTQKVTIYLIYIYIKARGMTINKIRR